jgi:hypothetical protein
MRKYALAIVAGLSFLSALGWATPTYVPGITLTTSGTIVEVGTGDDDLEMDVDISGVSGDKPSGAVSLHLEILIVETAIYDMENGYYRISGDIFTEDDITENGNFWAESDPTFEIDGTPTLWREYGYTGYAEWYWKDSNGDRLSTAYRDWWEVLRGSGTKPGWWDAPWDIH